MIRRGAVSLCCLGALLASRPAIAEPVLQDASKLDCDWAGCSLVTVTEAAKAALEKRKDYQGLTIRFESVSTDADLATVTKLPWVRKIDLRETVTDLTPLAKLTKLEEIVLLGTKPKSLQPIASLPALRRLDVADDADLGVLRSMKSLRELHITCEKAATVELLAELTWVTDLSIANRWEPLPHEAFAPLARMTQLEQLSLLGTGVKHLGHLQPLTKLRKLNLQHNAKLVDLEGLRGLPALEELTIQNGNGARKPQVLFELPRLKSLFVEDALLSEKQKAKLKAARPELTIY